MKIPVTAWDHRVRKNDYPSVEGYRLSHLDRIEMAITKDDKPTDSFNKISSLICRGVYDRACYWQASSSCTRFWGETLWPKIRMVWNLAVGLDGFHLLPDITVNPRHLACFVQSSPGSRRYLQNRFSSWIVSYNVLSLSLPRGAHLCNYSHSCLIVSTEFCALDNVTL